MTTTSKMKIIIKATLVTLFVYCMFGIMIISGILLLDIPTSERSVIKAVYAYLFVITALFFILFAVHYIMDRTIKWQP